MYAAIRRYKVRPEVTPLAIEQIMENFVPLIKQSPGLLAYYVLDEEDGAFVYGKHLRRTRTAREG